MKANELRIGNYIEFHAIGIRQGGIDHLDILDIADGRIIIPPKPIPLTEEWLHRCGFVRPSPDHLSYDREFYRLKISLAFQDEGETSFYPIIINESGNESVSLQYAECEYVHQLQNLYFALTGEELEINES